jgi:hypothetical protein
VRLERFEFNRLAILRYLLSAGLLAGMLLSRELWFPSNRSFPRVPFLIALPEAVVVPVERSLCAILVIALIATPVVRRATTVSAIAVATLGLQIVFDAMRLQPWIYQYLLLLGVLAVHREQTKDDQAVQRTLGLSQIVVAALYVWSGIQKLNFAFSHEILPKVLEPLHHVLSVHPPFVTTGIGMALVEVFIGCGLLFSRTRELCVWFAVATHVVILGLLITAGYNSVVWAWNAALPLIVVTLFWRSESAPWRTLRDWSAANRITRVAHVGVILTALAPALSFWGWWDMDLSGALYSGNTAVAVVRIDDEAYKKLPQTAQRQVFRTKNSGMQILPLLEWSMAELNVPPYPEPRIFRRLTSQVCTLAEGDTAVELVMKGRPSILDGRYQVTRVSCAQLGSIVQRVDAVRTIDHSQSAK